MPALAACLLPTNANKLGTVTFDKATQKKKQRKNRNHKNRVLKKNVPCCQRRAHHPEVAVFEVAVKVATRVSLLLLLLLLFLRLFLPKLSPSIRNHNSQSSFPSSSSLLSWIYVVRSPSTRQLIAATLFSHE